MHTKHIWGMASVYRRNSGESRSSIFLSAVPTGIWRIPLFAQLLETTYNSHHYGLATHPTRHVISYRFSEMLWKTLQCKRFVKNAVFWNGVFFNWKRFEKTAFLLKNSEQGEEKNAVFKRFERFERFETVWEQRPYCVSLLKTMM